ncbi:recombinase RecA [bacterium]|nr:recombinase RecA [bacterium]
MAKGKTAKQAGNDALSLVLAQIERKYGDGTVMRLGSDQSALQVDTIPTGSLKLDSVLGVGGIPRGRMIELYGPESSGKTTLALHIVAQAQAMGLKVLYVDAENALEPKYMKALGVDIDNLLITQPDSMEDGLGIADMMLRSGTLGLVVFDSLAAMVPRAELEGEIGDQTVGLQARLMSQTLRRLSNTVARSNAAVIFINQIRMKIGVMFGNPETTPGGRALKFYASVRLDIRRIKAIMEREENVGSMVRVRVVKNKLAPPFRSAEFPMRHGHGIWRTGELLELGLAAEIVEKSGSWYNLGETTLGQGMLNSAEFLDSNPDLMADLTKRVRADLGM